MSIVHIGAVVLENPLRQEALRKPVVLGSDTPTCGGNVISLEYENPSQESCPEKWFTDWETQEVIEGLQALWKAGGTYVADLTGGGSTVDVRFARANGVGDPKSELYDERMVHEHVRNHPQDKYFVELNLYVDRS